MFTQVRSANRRVSPVEDNKHKVVIKAVYVVLEPQYQNSLTEAAKSINQMNGPIGIDLSGYLIEELRNDNNFEDFKKSWTETLIGFHEKFGSWENRKGYNSWELIEI